MRPALSHRVIITYFFINYYSMRYLQQFIIVKYDNEIETMN